MTIDNHSPDASSRQASERWRHAGIEPALDDVLSDPLVHLVMRRDRLSRADVEKVIRTTHARAAARKARLFLIAAA